MQSPTFVLGDWRSAGMVPYNSCNMSAVYTLSNTTPEWYRAVTGLCRSGEPSPVRVTANGEVVVSKDSALKVESFSPEDGELHILVEGGIRGVILTPSADKANECDLRLNVMASVSDWALAFRILRAAIEGGVSVAAADGQRSISASEVIEDAALAQHSAKWTADQAAIAVQLDRAAENPEREVESHSAMLPLMGRAVMVNRQELNLPAGDLEALLVDRAQRYATAYEASLMSFPAHKGLKGAKGKTGQPVYFANFPHFPTLIPRQVQALTLHGASGSVIETFVPLSTFLQHLGDQVEQAGEYLYVSAIDFSSIPEVVAEFASMQGAVDAPTASRAVSPNVRQMIFSRQTTGDEVSDDPNLTAKDWEFLKEIPTLLFLVVAGADGSITKAGRDAFSNILDRLSKDGAKHGETMQRMVELSREDVTGTLQKLMGTVTHPGQYADAISRLRVLVDRKLPESEARKLKVGCVGLAKKIALSSGRMFGAKVTPAEKAAVNLVQQALGVTG
ncbi:MAG: hypothetical protein KDN22_11405 [Verrucomicrobiae bacterium]|nr:hypothetical protein [Verrucomicrobiae bacterium]